MSPFSPAVILSGVRLRPSRAIIAAIFCTVAGVLHAAHKASTTNKNTAMLTDPFVALVFLAHIVSVSFH